MISVAFFCFAYLGIISAAAGLMLRYMLNCRIVYLQPRFADGAFEASNC